MSPSTPRRTRANVFDVTRTDRDEPAPPPIGRILTPVVPTTDPPPIPEPPTLGTAVSRTVPTQSARPAAVPTDPTRRPRGSGGRAAATPSRITAKAARVPIPLYEKAEHLVKGPGRPSWGQLVAATCQRSQEEVVDAVLSRAQAEGDLLAPRGQNRRAVASTQVTARFTPDELEAFRAVQARATRAVERSGLATGVTATAVVAAALEVATR